MKIFRFIRNLLAFALVLLVVVVLLAWRYLEMSPACWTDPKCVEQAIREKLYGKPNYEQEVKVVFKRGDLLIQPFWKR